MIDFPASPTLGQQFTAAGVTWTWDGVKWTADRFERRLPAAGGRFDERRHCPRCRSNAALQPATKQYVDARPRSATTASSTATCGSTSATTARAGRRSGIRLIGGIYAASQASKGTWQRARRGASSDQGFLTVLAFTSSSAYTPLAADYFVLSATSKPTWLATSLGERQARSRSRCRFGSYSSLTGTFSGSFSNYGWHALLSVHLLDSGREHWTKIVITIPGDTAGTWVMSGNGGALYRRLRSWQLARPFAVLLAHGRLAIISARLARSSVVATNGATFYRDRRQAGDRQRRNAVQPAVAGQEHGRLPEVLSGWQLSMVSGYASVAGGTVWR